MASTPRQDDGRTDEARRLIGLMLLALLILIVAGAFLVQALIGSELHGVDATIIEAVRNKGDAERLAALARIATDEAKTNADRLAQLLNIVFGPVVTLIGSVTGFYFGAQSGRRPPPMG